MQCISEVWSKLDILVDYGFVYLYWATVNTKVCPALDGEECRRVYVTHFWLYYILFIIITIMFTYILTTEITALVSASAQSDAGAVIILAHIT